MPSPNPNYDDEMTRANESFLEDAVDVIYDDGSGLKKAKPVNFSFREHDYMRSLRGRDNTFLMVIDIDSIRGLSEEALNCAKDLYAYFGSGGVLKASGIKGMHVVPFKMQFPENFGNREITTAMRNLAYSAYLDSHIGERYGFPFMKRTSRTPINSIKYGYLDITMYNQNHMIRGFCRRFKNGRKINAWSVPINPNDSYKTVMSKVHLDTPPDWKIEIPTVVYDESMITHRYQLKIAGKIEIAPIETLEGSDNIENIFKKIYGEMPKKVQDVWDSDNPSHQEKFAMVCWLNHLLMGKVKDTDKRIDLIVELIISHMSMKEYRDSGRFSPSITQYQVNNIVTRKYSCPRWLLEKEGKELRS